MHRIDWYRVAGAIIGLLSALLVASILFEGVAHAAPTRAQVAQAVDPAFRHSDAPWIVSVQDLALYVDRKRAEALEEWRRTNGSAA